jgi:hypothetical protein
MLFGETVVVYCQNHTRHFVYYVRKMSFLTVTASFNTKCDWFDRLSIKFSKGYARHYKHMLKDWNYENGTAAVSSRKCTAASSVVLFQEHSARRKPRGVGAGSG